MACSPNTSKTDGGRKGESRDILGPLLFLLYINNVTDIFGGSCVCKLYADDIKLYSVLDSPLDFSDLQNNPTDLQQLSDRWQLIISDKKCSVLYLGKQRIMPHVNMVLGNNTVPQVNSSRNLGS